MGLTSNMINCAFMFDKELQLDIALLGIFCVLFLLLLLRTKGKGVSKENIIITDLLQFTIFQNTFKTD